MAREPIRWQTVDFVALAALIVAIYASSMAAPFFWEDDQFLVEQPFIKHWQTWGDLFLHPTILEAHLSRLFQPLVLVSFAVEYQAWRFAPIGYHLVNIALHLLSAWLLYLFVHELTSRRLAALAAAVAFAFHPIQVSAVAYVAGRVELLQAACSLAALITWFRALRTDVRRLQWWSYLSALLATTCALLASQYALGLPVLLALLGLKKWWWKGTFPIRKLALALLPIAALSVAFVLWRVWIVQLPLIPEVHVQLAWPRWILLACHAMLLGLRWLVWPGQQALWRPIELPDPLMHPTNLLAVAGVGLLLVFLILSLVVRRELGLSFGLAWYLLGLAPYVLWMSATLEFRESWLYFPSAGMAMMVGVAVAALWDRCRPSWRPAACAIGLLIAGLYGLQTSLYNYLWSHPIQLLTAWRRSQPTDERYLYQLGLLWEKRGALDQAETTYRALLHEASDRSRPLNGLGRIHLARGALDQALSAFQRAIDANALDSNAYHNVGLVLVRQHHLTEAEQFFREALNRNPFFLQALRHLGKLYWQQNEPTKALEVLDRAASLDPHNAELQLALAEVYTALGKLDDAQRAYRKAQRLLR